MTISSDDLIGLPVYTQGGNYLGKVVSFELDIESKAVSKYHVKTGLIQGLWHEQLIIDQAQVVKVTKEKMIVEDTTSPSLAQGLAPIPDSA